MVTKKKATTTKHKTVVKKRAKSSAKAPVVVYRTLKVSPDFPSFFEARVTKQTFYWSFLLLFIIVMQMIIVAVNLNASLTLGLL